MTYVLLMAILFDYNAGPTQMTAEFKDAASCQNAAREIKLQLATERKGTVLVEMCAAK